MTEPTAFVFNVAQNEENKLKMNQPLYYVKTPIPEMDSHRWNTRLTLEERQHHRSLAFHQLKGLLEPFIVPKKNPSRKHIGCIKFYLWLQELQDRVFVDEEEEYQVIGKYKRWRFLDCFPPKAYEVLWRFGIAYGGFDY